MKENQKSTEKRKKLQCSDGTAISPKKVEIDEGTPKKRTKKDELGGSTPNTPIKKDEFDESTPKIPTKKDEFDKAALTKRDNSIKAYLNWYSGSLRSRSKPSDIMNEVYLAIKSCDFEWKSADPFQVVARRKHPVTNLYTKMILQLYQEYVRIPSEGRCETSYVLAIKFFSNDDKSKEGLSSTESVSPATLESCSIMEFLEMCSVLVVQLTI